MMFRLRARQRGEHYHLRVLSGPDREHLASAGTLTLVAEEWSFFKRVLLDGRGTCEWGMEGEEEVISIFDSLEAMSRGLPYGTLLQGILRPSSDPSVPPGSGPFHSPGG